MSSERSSAALVSAAPTTCRSIVCRELSRPRLKRSTEVDIVNTVTPPRTRSGTRPTSSICQVSFVLMLVVLRRCLMPSPSSRSCVARADGDGSVRLEPGPLAHATPQCFHELARLQQSDEFVAPRKQSNTPGSISPTRGVSERRDAVEGREPEHGIDQQGDLKRPSRDHERVDGAVARLYGQPEEQASIDDGHHIAPEIRHAHHVG